eukprot:scaffold227297_cov27-Tisochrysis_lutea.AAC.2
MWATAMRPHSSCTSPTYGLLLRAEGRQTNRPRTRLSPSEKSVAFVGVGVSASAALAREVAHALVALALRVFAATPDVEALVLVTVARRFIRPLLSTRPLLETPNTACPCCSLWRACSPVCDTDTSWSIHHFPHSY